MVNASQVVITVKIEGTLEDYEMLMDAINSALRQLLRCSQPHCFLTVTAEAGSVVLTIIATDIADPPTIVSAANTIATADLSNLSAVLDQQCKERYDPSERYDRLCLHRSSRCPACCHSPVCCGQTCPVATTTAAVLPSHDSQG